MSQPTFFATADVFRDWLAKNGDNAGELWVGFYKRESGLASITWPESVDAALCFGWIDGVRKSIDGTAYKIRFTPRKKGSKWSAVNLRRMEELICAGQVSESGQRCYIERTRHEPAGYSYEQRRLIELTAEQKKLFQQNKGAWKFFEAQANWYKKTALWWIVSAKQEATRDRRLQQLIADSANGVFAEATTAERILNVARKACR